MCGTASFTLAIALAILLGAMPAAAVPVQGQFYNDLGQCDDVPDTTLTHELGDSAVFPIDEQLVFTITPTTTTVCVPDDGLPNDWNIRIVNIGSVYWQDVFFAADAAMFFGNGNYDGHLEDITDPGLVEAFRIDSVGTNNNLLTESIAFDGILEPGEIWSLFVTNFDFGTAPAIDSVGQFAVSSALNPPSTASILANPVPEPATMVLLAAGGVALVRRRRRKRCERI